MAWRAWTAPGMNADLLAYWQAVEASDRAAAEAARASFDAAHRTADTLFRITLFAVLGAIAAFPSAFLAPTSPRPADG
jgi:hypothetical protein